MRETGRKVERIGDKRERPREKEKGEMAELFSLFSPLNFLTELSSFYYSLYP